jgi:hypothetical protein
VLSAVEALRGKEQEIIDKYNSQHPVPNVEQYQSYEVKFESLREEIASMESETEAYLRQEVNFYPSIAEAFEEIKEEKIEIKNTEPIRLADIQAKIHEVTPEKDKETTETKEESSESSIDEVVKSEENQNENDANILETEESTDDINKTE